MNTSIGSTISNQCSLISIQSKGDSKYAYGGYYEAYIFGTYRFTSTDGRGNNIYRNITSPISNIEDIYYFIFKDMDDNWVVRAAS